MKNKAFILMRPERLLEIMDARQNLEVYLVKKDDSFTLIKSGLVYEFLTDEEFLKEYKDANIIGINSMISNTSLYIEEV